MSVRHLTDRESLPPVRLTGRGERVLAAVAVTTWFAFCIVLGLMLSAYLGLL